jgi:hypothetical protein
MVFRTKVTREVLNCINERPHDDYYVRYNLQLIVFDFIIVIPEIVTNAKILIIDTPINGFLLTCS